MPGAYAFLICAAPLLLLQTGVGAAAAAAAAAVAGSGAPAGAAPGTRDRVLPQPYAPDPFYRLSGDVIPTHYNVHVAPRRSDHFDSNKFDGAVEISAYVTSPTISITMHAAAEVEFTKYDVDITRGNKEKITCLDVNKVGTYEFVELYLAEILQVKDAINIQIKYTASYGDNMEGLYMSTYNFINEEGEHIERVLFASHFAPTYARKVFPSFDEPGFKATFKLTVDTPPGFRALSNTPIEERTVRNDNGQKSDAIVFLETPKMSTYLLAFVIYEEFTYAQSSTINSSVPITSWAAKGVIDAEQAQFSESEAPRILSLMENYTGIPFAHGNLQKIDEVAIPDFPTAATENWGLITYRENFLLVDPEQGSADDHQLVSEAIALEIAQQWFGNLVTPEWWNYAWLSKGFARYFQYWLLGQLNPDWRMEEQLVVDIQQSIFDIDSILSTSTLTADVYSPEQILERLGPMVYNKGSSLLRMIKNIMGEEHFQEAIKSYLQNNAFDSVSPEDLFAALDAHAPEGATPEEDVLLSDILRQWTQTNSNFPVLQVDAWNDHTLFVSQERYCLSECSIPQEYYVQYQIHQQSGASTPLLWSAPGRRSMDYIDVSTTEQWVLINSTGYFRVNYWRKNWERLGEALRADVDALAPLDRAQLVDDALGLARAGHLPYSTALDFVRYLAHETDYVPWAAAWKGLDFLGNMVANADEEGVFAAFMRELLEGVYKHVGFEATGDHLQRRQRVQVLKRACAAGHVDCLQTALQRLDAFLHHGTAVEPDLRSVVYCYGLKAGGESIWNRLLGLYQISESPGERALIIQSLGCSNDVNILRNYLELSLNPEFVRQQDAASIFTAVYSNPVGVEEAIQFLHDRLPDIEKAYGGVRDMKTIVWDISTRLNTDTQRQQISDITGYLIYLEETGTNAFENTQINVWWFKNRSKEALNAMRPVQLL